MSRLNKDLPLSVRPRVCLAHGKHSARVSCSYCFAAAAVGSGSIIFVIVTALAQTWV